MKYKTLENNIRFPIQKRTGIILFLLTFTTATLNLVNGVINFGETFVQAFINISVLPTLIIAFLLLTSAFNNSVIFRYLQIVTVFLAGFTTVVLTIPGTLTGTIFLLFGMALAYQYGYFASKFYVKILIAFSIYTLATLANILLVHKLNLPNGIPSILFSLGTFYLFWMVFREEINTYLIHTNQLNKKLDQAASENERLGHITADQAILIGKKNRILEKNLKEKTEIEIELRRTLKTKDVLLQEVHHRVKNNLTVINGLLNLQISDDNSDTTNDFIKTNSNRLYAMAAVHEAVYQSEGYESVNLADYFSDITQNLFEIYSGNGDLNIDIKAEDVEVTIDIAVPLGIILNDCVSNSLIYGFNSQIISKVISINIRETEEIEITISDNGIRFPIEVYTAGQDTSFSIWLIKLLVEDQLRGSVVIDYDQGNRWTMRFPHLESNSASHVGEV